MVNYSPNICGQTNSPDRLPYISFRIIRGNLIIDQCISLVGDHFTNSHQLFSWLCIDTVRRKLLLVTLGTYRVNKKIRYLQSYFWLFTIYKTFPENPVGKWMEHNTPAETFQEQRNISKGSPLFLDRMSQTEICVPFLQSQLWYQFQAFAALFP